MHPAIFRQTIGLNAKLPLLLGNIVVLDPLQPALIGNPIGDLFCFDPIQPEILGQLGLLAIVFDPVLLDPVQAAIFRELIFLLLLELSVCREALEALILQLAILGNPLQASLFGLSILFEALETLLLLLTLLRQRCLVILPLAGVGMVGHFGNHIGRDARIRRLLFLDAILSALLGDLVRLDAILPLLFRDLILTAIFRLAIFFHLLKAAVFVQLVLFDVFQPAIFRELVQAAVLYLPILVSTFDRTILRELLLPQIIDATLFRGALGPGVFGPSLLCRRLLPALNDALFNNAAFLIRAPLRQWDEECDGCGEKNGPFIERASHHVRSVL
ncbi:MAG TPA: hypothetical protein VK961_24900 [Chthoniobacter sp.]|nr:hypothetical protein [Chthoniobacter sp.]